MNDRRLLATDLDGTFIGDPKSMYDLWHQLVAAGILMVFSTGRHMRSIREFQAEHTPVARPEACICMVGTEIWLMSRYGYSLDKGWAEHISTGWDRQAVEGIMRGTDGVTPQPHEWQSPLKASYYLDQGPPSKVDRIASQLQDAGIEAKVVYSAGRFLDVLPARSGKGNAVARVSKWLEVDPSNVITAGDSGNDLDMMRPELGFRSIAVGNSTPEVRMSGTDNLYQANAHFAAGVKEGLIHYGWLPASV